MNASIFRYIVAPSDRSMLLLTIVKIAIGYLDIGNQCANLILSTNDNIHTHGKQ